MKILVVYGTTEGHTRKVAERVGEYIKSAGHKAQLADSTDKPSSVNLADYSAVIIAGSVHQRHYQGSLAYFIHSRLDELRQLPTALLSVNLSMVTATDCKEANADVQKLLEDTGWTPDSTKLVAGALKYSQYDFFKRQIMKIMAKQGHMPTDTEEDYEFTDWNDLQEFIDEFIRTEVTAAVS